MITHLLLCKAAFLKAAEGTLSGCYYPLFSGTGLRYFKRKSSIDGLAVTVTLYGRLGIFCRPKLYATTKIVYCDEAVFYDEQPTSVKIMLRQSGCVGAKGTACLFYRLPRICLKGIFETKAKGGGNF